MASTDVKPNGGKVAAAPVVAKPEALKPEVVQVAAPTIEAARPIQAPAVVKSATKPAAKPKPVAAKRVTKPVKRPTAAVSAVIKSAIKKELPMNDTIKATAEKTQAQAKAMFADVNDRAKGAMEKGSKMFEEMNDLNKGNIEALVESSKIAAKGIETMGKDAAEYTRKSLEGATAAMKTLASVKSPTEFMKLHSDYVRSTFDAMIAQASHSTEAMLKLAGEVGQPISNRIAVAAEKVKIAA